MVCEKSILVYDEILSRLLPAILARTRCGAQPDVNQIVEAKCAATTLSGLASCGFCRLINSSVSSFQTFTQVVLDVLPQSRPKALGLGSASEPSRDNTIRTNVDAMQQCGINGFSTSNMDDVALTNESVDQLDLDHDKLGFPFISLIRIQGVDRSSSSCTW